MFALKVAVAVAIIKNKPKNTSSQEYAENLQRKFILKQSQLEIDYEEAKLKIVQLEEKIAKFDTQNTKADANKEGEILQILTPPPSSENSQNNTGNAHTAKFGYNNQKQDMVTLEIENSKFIQSIVSLQNLTSTLQAFKNDEIKTTAAENISSLSNILSRGVVSLSENCLCRSAEAVTKLLRLYPWLEDCDEVMEGVCRLIETVLTRMRQNSNLHQFPPHRQKHSLMQMLVIFMRTSSPHFAMMVLDNLIDAWEEFCQGLRNSRKTRKPLDPQIYDSSFFIITGIELTVKSWTSQCNLDPAFLHILQQRLEKSLLHLTDFFPLVAQTIWKITSIIENILQENQTGS